MSAVISFLTNISLQGQKLSYVDTAPFNVNGTTYRGLITFGQSGSDFIITQRFSTFLFHNLQVSESQFVAQLANTPFLPAEIKGAIGSNAFFLTTTNNQTVWFLRTTASTGTQSNVDLVSSQTGFITNSSNSFMTVINSQLSMGPIAAQFNVAQPSNSNIIIGAISLSGGGGGGGGGITLTPSGALTPPLYYVPFSSATTGAVTTMGTDVSGLIYDNNTHALSVRSIVTNKMGLGLAPVSLTNISIGTDVLASTTGINNIGVGNNALKLNTTGTQNIGVGLNVLSSNTTGGNNIGVGIGVLFANTTGYNNTGVGPGALISNTTGYNNIGVGSNTLLSNTIGIHNIGVGTSALQTNATGIDNIGVGDRALFANTTGSANIGIGTNALQANTTGQNNIGIGDSTLSSNTVGQFNIAVGNNSLNTNTSGGNNIGIGSSALQLNTIGQNNIGIGYNTLLSNINGDGNIGIGRTVLQSHSIGNNNIGIGNSALLTNTIGISNIAIGVDAGINYETSESNNIVIGNNGVIGDGVAPATGVIRIGTIDQQAAFILPTLIRRNAQVEHFDMETILASDIIGPTGGILLSTSVANISWRMPTSAEITTALGENVVENDTFEFAICAKDTGNITLINSDLNFVILAPYEIQPLKTTKVIMQYDGSIWNVYL